MGQEKFLEEGNTSAKEQELIWQRKDGRVFMTKGTACVKGKSSTRIQNTSFNPHNDQCEHKYRGI